jgi:hypothetical protein
MYDDGYSIPSSIFRHIDVSSNYLITLVTVWNYMLVFHIQKIQFKNNTEAPLLASQCSCDLQTTMNRPPVNSNYLLETNVVIVDEIKEKGDNYLFSILTVCHPQIARQMSIFNPIVDEALSVIQWPTFIMSEDFNRSTWTEKWWLDSSFVYVCFILSSMVDFYSTTTTVKPKTINYTCCCYVILPQLIVSFKRRRYTSGYITWIQRTRSLPIAVDDDQVINWLSIVLVDCNVHKEKNFMTQDNCLFSKDLSTWTAYAINSQQERKRNEDGKEERKRRKKN